MTREELMKEIENSVEYGLIDEILCYMNEERKNFTPEEILAMYKEAALNFFENFEYDDGDDE